MGDPESEFSCNQVNHTVRVTIIGLGLMGGSLALAIKKFHPQVELIGIDKDEDAIHKAKRRGAIDRGFTNLEEAVSNSKLIFLACPIGAIIDLLKKLPYLLDEGAIVSDLGSTKSEICQVASRNFSERGDVHFIGGHPMTGGTTKGIEEANPLMFENAIYVLTPFEDERGGTDTKNLKTFLEKLGAEVIYIDPTVHDRAVAYVSHLPQLVAVTLTNVVSEKEDLSSICSLLAAGGFKDMTRIASSPFEIWEDIFQTNGKVIKDALDDFVGHLNWAKGKLKSGKLREQFSKSINFRDSIPRRQKGLISPLHRISVFLPDHPGALAELTSVLSKEGLNIKDIELLRVRENFEGIFQVYFDSQKDTKRAAQILNQAGFQSRVGK